MTPPPVRRQHHRACEGCQREAVVACLKRAQLGAFAVVAARHAGMTSRCLNRPCPFPRMPSLDGRRTTRHNRATWRPCRTGTVDRIPVESRSHLAYTQSRAPSESLLVQRAWRNTVSVQQPRAWSQRPTRLSTVPPVVLFTVLRQTRSNTAGLAQDRERAMAKGLAPASDMGVNRATCCPLHGFAPDPNTAAARSGHASWRSGLAA